MRLSVSEPCVVKIEGDIYEIQKAQNIIFMKEKMGNIFIEGETMYGKKGNINFELEGE